MKALQPKIVGMSFSVVCNIALFVYLRHGFVNRFYMFSSTNKKKSRTAFEWCGGDNVNLQYEQSKG